MRKIKIFLASSGELKNERKAIWELTAEVGELYPDLHLDPFEWEIDLPSGSVREEYIQQAINPKLLECDIVFVLFYSKAGAFTIEELNLAIANDKKVFVYFKEGFSAQNLEENERYNEVLKIKADIETANRILSKKYREGGLKEIYQMDLAKHLTALAPRRIRPLLSDDLIYQDLDKQRKLPEIAAMREYYFPRKADDKLREALADSSKNFIIVKGGPLAGKTRAALEALKKRPGLRLLIPDLYGAEGWRLEPGDASSLLIFNDFDLYCETASKEAVNKLLHECAANKVRVLATCKTGPEFNILQDSIETRFWENRLEVEMPPLRRDEFTQIEQYFQSKEIRLDEQAYKRLDYHVGSLFLDLDTMRDRYRRVKNDRDGLPHGILQTIKAFWVGYNKLPGGAYDKKKVKVYQQLYSGKSHSLQEWDRAFAHIEVSDNGLGFIRFTEEGSILVEEAYLRVIINDVADKRYEEEIEELFPDPAERTEFGFYGARYWTIKLNEKQKLSKKEGENFLAEMRAAGVTPDYVTFTSLINKAVDAGEARAWLAEMRAAGVTPDYVTFTSLINKAVDAGEARAWLAEMRAAGVTPDYVTFTSLINKAVDAGEARAWLAEMRAAGVTPDYVTFTSLINKAVDAGEARAWLAEMRAAGVTPDYVTFTSLINKAVDAGEARAWLAEMRAAGVTPDYVTFTSLINKAVDAGEARAWLAEMRAAGVTPDYVTFTSLINKAVDAGEARAWLAEMRAAGVTPDYVTFTSLINKAVDAGEARAWLAEMISAKIRPDIFTISSLLKKCGKDCEGIKWVESVREEHRIRVNDFYARQLESTRRRLGCSG